MKHKLVVLDWNGTILADTIASWKAANICLEMYGSKPISLARYRATASFPIIHFYAKNGVNVDRILSNKSLDNEVFKKSYEDFAKNARTRKGVRELLNWLKEKGVTCIILSNYLTCRIEEQISRLGLDGFFHHIDANDGNGAQILEYTSKQQRLSKYMLGRGYTPLDTVIIGDSSEEPAVARALGLTSIAITGGSFSRTQLRHAKPDHMTDHMGDVSSILRKIW